MPSPDEPRIDIPDATKEFLASVDKPGTILVVFDLGKGTYRLPRPYIEALARYLKHETHAMTIRSGGNSYRFAGMLNQKDSPAGERRRFEFFFTRDDYNRSKEYYPPPSTIHLFDEFDITPDSDLAKEAIELDFRRHLGHPNAECVFHDKDPGFWKEVDEYFGRPESKITLEALHSWDGIAKEKGRWAVLDWLMVRGWQDVPKATHILHMGGSGYRQPYELKIIEKSGLPAFHAFAADSTGGSNHD